MKIKRLIDNGNIEVGNPYELSYSVDSRSIDENWENVSINTDNHFFDTALTLSKDNYNNTDSCLLATPTEYITQTIDSSSKCNLARGDSGLVCNRQFRLNSKLNANFDKIPNNTESANLEGVTESFLTTSEVFVGRCDDSFPSTPNHDERVFRHSDPDDMSDNYSKAVPRGIVNPNYPGFQHLAHTLQEYTSNIDNYYQSENDMTDEDVDVEITDSSHDFINSATEMSIHIVNINNNINNNNTEILTNKLESKCNVNLISKTIELNSTIENKQEIPDLLKTIKKNNNDETITEEFNCSDADIENNFGTEDIIGDFNKEVEDEIKQLLNYNINIEDDLDELRKDIQYHFTQPLESTLNNISDVVNHVIKKLVESNCDTNVDSSIDNKLESEKRIESQFNGKKLDSTNESKLLCTEISPTRPTFLLLPSKIATVKDAVLSDAKDVINIKDYETDDVSNNIENTIKKLSTELRKIIPQLDELRERDKLFAKTTNMFPFTMKDANDIAPRATDGNCNNIENTSKPSRISQNPFIRQTEKIVDITNCEPSSFVNKSSKRSKVIKTMGEDCQHDTTSSTCSKVHNTSVQTKEDCDLGMFDVYNIETALPTLDFDAIESHLKAAKDAERRKRNDREEIRRRLAMGADNDDYYSLGHIDRPGKKPSLQSRLQSGRNLQICFMNETASDNESQASDVEKNFNVNNKSLSKSSIFSKSNYSLSNHPYQTRPLSVSVSKHDKISTVQSGAKLRPSSFIVKTPKSKSSHSLGQIEIKESDFFALQATLQTEARIALAQAKEMARIQMERERRGRASSPVGLMVRASSEKARAPLAPHRRRLSRRLLTDINVAQLQVIVNELHGQIESLNGELVRLLLARDDLHMGQDSMLVDIEDLTRYLGVKEQTKKTKGSSKTAARRLASLVHK